MLQKAKKMSKLNLNFTKIGENFLKIAQKSIKISQTIIKILPTSIKISQKIVKICHFCFNFFVEIFCSFFALGVKDGLEPAPEHQGTLAVDLIVVGDVGLALSEPVFKLRLKLERIIVLFRK